VEGEVDGSMDGSVGGSVDGVRTWSDDEVAELRRSLDEDGYFVVPGVVSADRIAEFRAHILDTYASFEKFEGGGTYSGHLNCFPGASSRFFFDELSANGLVDVITSLRPEQAKAVRATLNFNLPGSVEQHYHTDGLYIEDFLICNIAVVDTDLFNGAIDVLPGTHRRYYPFWELAIERKQRLSRRLPMLAGDVLVRHSTLWHRGMPNRADVPRPMMSITFGEASAPDGDPFDVHDGEMFFYPNWFNTSRLGRLRERTFVAAPLSYSSYRFVKSLRGKPGYSSY
jgi:hypothetical protein